MCFRFEPIQNARWRTKKCGNQQKMESKCREGREKKKRPAQTLNCLTFVGCAMLCMGHTATCYMLYAASYYTHGAQCTVLAKLHINFFFVFFFNENILPLATIRTTQWNRCQDFHFTRTDGIMSSHFSRQQNYLRKFSSAFLIVCVFWSWRGRFVAKSNVPNCTTLNYCTCLNLIRLTRNMLNILLLDPSRIWRGIGWPEKLCAHFINVACMHVFSFIFGSCCRLVRQASAECIIPRTNTNYYIKVEE